MPRHAARVDASQAEIVTAWRAVGCLVVLTFTVGDGCPDAFVFNPRLRSGQFEPGTWTAHELKARTGRLTVAQRELHAFWPGAIYVTRTVEEALQQVGVDIDESGELPPRRAVRV